MKIDGWWREPLLEWADTTGFSVDFCAYPKPNLKRELGEWWLNAGRWHLHLDAVSYVRLRPEPEVAVRRTVTWMLSLLRQTQGPTAEMLLTSWLENLLDVSAEALDKLVIGEGLPEPPESGWVEKYGTGWLALVTPQYPKTVTLEERAELRPNMRQVIDSYTSDGFIGWLRLNLAAEQGLVFIRDEVLAQEDWEDPLTTRRHGTGGEHPGVTGAGEDAATAGDTALPDVGKPETPVRSFAQNLVDSLTQDVLVSCEITIGSHLTASADLGSALLTLAIMQRRRAYVEQGSRLMIWGEEPLQILLQTVPSKGVAWFLAAARQTWRWRTSTEGLQNEGSVDVLSLPDELISSLHGLVAANLNVSEAARLLFVHRNTLIHRVERIRELTGYDVRNFREALVLWLSYNLRTTDRGEHVNLSTRH